MAALPLHVVEVTPGTVGVHAARQALTVRLDDAGPPFALVPAPGRHTSADYSAMIRRCVRPDLPVDDDATVFVAATSGSTGTPRGVVITRDNLRAAVEGSWRHITGLDSCAWVLALPVTSIGGFGAIVRAHFAGTRLHVLESVGGGTAFDPRTLVDLEVVEPFAISLVPRQLDVILAHRAATAWLGRAHAVLVGAAATPRDLVMRARESGLALVTTYGMTETTGGCVYDGTPLPGVRIDVGDDGRIDVIGRQVAAGYRGNSDGFSGAGDDRRFRTADHGRWVDGRLTVLGRTDDVVMVHGVNVGLGAVESVIRDLVGVRDCAVIDVPGERTGQRLIAYVVVSDPACVTGIGPAVGERLGGAARPDVVIVESLPVLPNGKIDRAALRTAGE
jgi:O-succinylbenzoic acid--CoA ligase